MKRKLLVAMIDSGVDKDDGNFIVEGTDWNCDGISDYKYVWENAPDG